MLSLLKAEKKIWTLASGLEHSGFVKNNNSGNNMKTKIDDCKKYWNEFVQPDYLEFQARPGDLRKAFHCAISLFASRAAACV